MSPADLAAAHFAGYPPQAGHLAIEHLELLRRLPLAFVPLLLREVIAYDWKFPAERRELDNQFLYLGELDAGRFQQVLQPFAKLQLSSTLERANWVNEPALFSEQLTAHLWATHQIDQFRTAAVDYVRQLNAAATATIVACAAAGDGTNRTRRRPEQIQAVSQTPPARSLFQQSESGGRPQSVDGYIIRQGCGSPHAVRALVRGRRRW